MWLEKGDNRKRGQELQSKLCDSTQDGQGENSSDHSESWGKDNYITQVNGLKDTGLLLSETVEC